MRNFVRTVYIIVEFNMDNFCEWLSLFAYSKKTTLSDYHHQLLECFYDEDRHLLKSNKINITLE